jgi:hypothetical protein
VLPLPPGSSAINNHHHGLLTSDDADGSGEAGGLAVVQGSLACLIPHE